MAEASFRLDEEDFREAIRHVKMDATQLLVRLVEQIGWEAVSWLRSHTSETRPPARKGEAERPAHPGRWADVSGDLARAYRFEIWVDRSRVRWSKGGDAITVAGVIPKRIENAGSVTLFIINGWEYAAALEAKDGYFVISGLGESGSPVESALRRAVSLIPGWEIEG